MRVVRLIMAGASVIGVALPTQAQQPGTSQRKAPSTRPMISPDGCTIEDGRVECRSVRRADLDSALMKRAVLGLQLSTTGSARDTIGVFVARVTPKGPAENAGVVEGDRIVAINGVDLRVNAADAGDEYASGLPSRRLTREVQKLSPGTAVTLRVYSGGRTRDVRVTTGRASDFRERGFGYFFEDFPGAIRGEIPRGMRELRGQPGIRMQSFPRMRIESMPRIQIDGLRDRLLRLDAEGGLKEGVRVRSLSPSAVRTWNDDVLILGPDGELLEPARARAKAKAEKEKQAKKK